MAQIAAEIRRGHVKNPNKIETENLIIKFTTQSKERKKISTGQESKRFWLGSLGVKG